MISLSIFIAVLIASLLVTAIVLAWTARLLGSTNGKLRVGLAATLLILAVNIAFAVLGSLLGAAWPSGALVSSLILLLMESIVIFIMLSRSFRLSIGRTFGPFLAVILMGLAEFAFAL